MRVRDDDDDDDDDVIEVDEHEFAIVQVLVVIRLFLVALYRVNMRVEAQVTIVVALQACGGLVEL